VATAVLVALVAAGIAGAWLVQPPAATAADPKGGPPLAYAIAPGPNNNTVLQVVDTVGHRTVTSVDVPERPVALAVTPDARHVLVAVDPPEPVSFGPASSTGGLPAATGVDPLGLPRVIVVDVATNKVVPDVEATVGNAPAAIAIAPDGSTAYVLSQFGGITPVRIGAGPSLAVGTFIPITGTETLSDLAVSPDGKVLYVVDRLRALLLRFALPAGSPMPALGLRTAGYHTLVVAPDGAHVYVAGGDVGKPALLARLDPQDEAGITPLQVAQGIGIPAIAIGTRPDGTSSLWVLDDAGNRLYEAPVPSPPNFTLTAPVSLPSPTQAPLRHTDLFAVPDGSRVEVSALFDVEGPGRGVVRAVDVGARALVPCGDPDDVCPAGGLAIAVTPDQAPTAKLVVTPGLAGQDTTLDASTSTIMFGTIARYDWDFGDGTKATTTTPVTTHRYAAPGPYTATVTETSWSGASVSTAPPSTVFTGQTMTRRGGPQARTRATFTVGGGGTPTEPPVPTPMLTIVPATGPPGTVTTVTGTGFPKDTDVKLSWDLGIRPVTTAKSNGDGSFTWQVLVFPRDDSLGPRKVVALDFPPASAPFLVGPPSLQPGGDDLEVIFRR
jgi:hypothetical protein